MSTVTHYDFGIIRVGDRVYRNDIIVTPTRIVERWWREEGHRFTLEDFRKYGVLDEEVEVVVLGTGYYGLVTVDPEVVEWFRKRGVEVIVKPSREAVEIYNELVRAGKKVMLAIHLTC